MRIRLQNELLLVNILAILLILIITFFPSNVLRIILGLPIVLFFPGYTLIVALFPTKNTLDSVERVALSFGSSLIIVPIIGLILNYTPWGISLYPVLISLTIFIVITSIVAWYRRQRRAPAERFTVSFNLKLFPWRGESVTSKALFIILIVTILGAIGTLSYVLAVPKVGEKFTEFYVSGLEGKATDYPKELKVGEQGIVIIGIINREHEMMSYRVKVKIDGVSNSEIEPIALQHNEKREIIVSFTPNRAGDNQEVEFLLYKNGGNEPYRRVRLPIDVKQ